ncbi:hypothetical protein DMC47_44905 [Nostoc sp. 3335mG]|nr:hypothetical protein DMC47_44905 [Nostoc sp. 3335mG]
MQPGYRRRILIEPAPGCVTAELEDDYHRMVVTLRHADGVVSDVSSQMKRAPWTGCPGAMEQLRRTFEGHPLAAFARRGEKTRNCTHLHDLALFAAGHADEAAPIAYDIHVSDPADGVREARLDRDGALLLHWTLDGDRFLAPADLAGRRMHELGDWIAAQDKPTAEVARILRWASMIAQGRAMDMPAGMPATAWPLGSCFHFQPEVARDSTRLPGADVDFSAPGMAPLADRASSFVSHAYNQDRT